MYIYIYICICVYIYRVLAGWLCFSVFFFFFTFFGFPELLFWGGWQAGLSLVQQGTRSTAEKQKIVSFHLLSCADEEEEEEEQKQEFNHFQSTLLRDSWLEGHWFRPALKPLFEPHMQGLVAKKDLELPGSLYESFIDAFHIECKTAWRSPGETEMLLVLWHTYGLSRPSIRVFHFLSGESTSIQLFHFRSGESTSFWRIQVWICLKLIFSSSTADLEQQAWGRPKYVLLEQLVWCFVGKY